MIEAMPSVKRIGKKVRKTPLRLLLAFRHRITPPEKIIVLHLKDHFRFGPYLMAAFANRGYSLEVVRGGAYAPSSRMLYRMGFGMVSVPRTREGHSLKTLIHDAPVEEMGIAPNWRRTIRLDYDYYRRAAPRSVRGEEVFGPYFMHPNVYESGLHQEVRALRKRKRSIRVFFAGTVHREEYSSDFHWPYPNRDLVIQSLMDVFSEEVERIDVHTDKRCFSRTDHRIVLAITDAVENTLDKHVLTQREMLRFASSSDFFINPPGIRIPHSHNVIEAMSVGAIPILAYGDLFEPALVDMQTCIGYHDIPEFVAKVRCVLDMPKAQIARMREDVIRYYDEHLAPEALYRKLEAAETSEVWLRMHNSHVVSQFEYLGLVNT